MEANLNDFLDELSVLVGVATNIYQKLGDNGRGIFPIDSLQNSKIMTPENLLVDSDNLGISQGEIMIKDKLVTRKGKLLFWKLTTMNFLGE